MDSSNHKQKRIVAGMEKQMRRGDALEAQLRQTRTVGGKFLESLLHHALAPEPKPLVQAAAK